LATTENVRGPDAVSFGDGPPLRLPSPLEELHDEALEAQNVRLYLKRDDLIHPDLPGNKWRKLERNLQAAGELGCGTILTFGGAYSNHIRATAAAGRHFGFSTIGVIRGEEHLPLNPSLGEAVRHGMTLAYLDRTTYRQKGDPEVVEGLRERFGDFYLIPEGGGNELGVRGCAEIAREIEVEFDLICCPCGTGATLAGLAAGLARSQRARAMGFAALKGGAFLAGEVERLQARTFGAPTQNWTVNTEFHFGGFARRTERLDRFIADMHQRHGLTLEWVYVAKMLYGLFAMAEEGHLSGQRIVAVITG
jgi:1-aminocyclopropane-1-carboxylate deaminase